MKNVVMLALVASTLGSISHAQVDEQGLADLTTGSVVRLSARRPVVTLGRAVVLGRTNDALVVSQSKQTYTIAASNLIELVVLERAEPPPQADQPDGTDGASSAEGKGSAASRGGLPSSMLAALWQKITSFWK